MNYPIIEQLQYIFQMCFCIGVFSTCLSKIIIYLVDKYREDTKNDTIDEKFEEYIESVLNIKGIKREEDNEDEQDDFINN